MTDTNLPVFEFPPKLGEEQPMPEKKERKKRGPRRTLVRAAQKPVEKPKRAYRRKLPAATDRPFDLSAALILGNTLTKSEAEFIGSLGKVMQTFTAESRKKVLTALGQIFR